MLLNSSECRIWLEHLETVVKNRRRGAAKAAATRRRKKAAQCPDDVQEKTANEPLDSNREESSGEECLCCSCGKDYFKASSDCEELWVGCDLCSKWYCGTCENLCTEPHTDSYSSKTYQIFHLFI